MNYEHKYLKYKNKYLNLLNYIQTGGHIAFDKSSDPVAAYIFAKDKDGQTYIGLVRKLYRDGRSIIPRDKPHSGYIKTGAAGTKQEYWGKWTSIGGNRKSTDSNLQAIISELNDETDFYMFGTGDVDLGLVGIPHKNSSNCILKCHFVRKIDGVVIFVFEIIDLPLFFSIFPKVGKTTPQLLSKSSGEIDATRSLTINDIYKNQSIMISTSNNNYFISYFLKNLINTILPIIDSSHASRSKLKILADTRDRIPSELLHPIYTRDKSNSYH
jgi:hypothetical protein